MVRLDHPNVSKFYQFYEDASHIYLICELLTEGDFSALNNKCEQSVLQVLFQDVFRGVAYCHSEGIAHRDLKFENCLRTKGSDRMIGKVIDFGLSAIKPDSVAGELYMKESLGTKFFVAPEVIERRSYGVKCDCWSLGIMIYIVLTGEFPFQENNENAPSMPTDKLFQRILHSKFRLRPLDKAHAPVSAVQLIKGLLNKNPTDSGRLDATTALEMPGSWLSAESSSTQASDLKRGFSQKMTFGLRGCRRSPR
ncbi:unnamed protein product [Prorocentrum cordatum]|uniref:Protein kinase domain-containing protein n=1 Tax=Prorocentrum cordatum TaxID=2364126 RepID=A0ABN9U7L1_9DINO|nr:unnamed protein product [Polarella glacialis]